MAVVGSTVEIEKSASDPRLYRSIVLPNKLQALLIHDPSTDKAAAALDVHIGSFSEPNEIPGLAHFLEHMLFLGTEKYPDEGEYSAYLNEHGGASNAYTDQEDTNYHFEVLPEHLEGALDRFAQFFISPLFTEDVTMREMQAVDAENSKNLQSDAWRLQQLARHAGNPAHPYSRFSVGSLSTLLERPKTQGIDIRKELLAFHAKYYSANAMKLVVLSSQPLDTLEEWVRSKFTPVPNKDIQIPKWNIPPYLPEQLSQCYHVVPVKDTRRLELLFPGPSWNDHWQTKPDHYVSHLLGHEGPGSILSYLKQKKWATALVAGGGQEGSNFALFRVEIELTPAGFTNIDDVVKTVLQYVGMLRGNVQEWIWNEVKNVDDLRFRFKDPEKPLNHVIMLATHLHLFPTQHVMTAPVLMSKYDKGLIDQLLATITPQNMLMAVISRSFKAEATHAEPWYQTKYNVLRLTPQRIAAWSNPPPNAALYLPPPNIFIPENLSLCAREGQLHQYPRIVHSSPLSTVWHKLDDTFLKPKANIYIRMTSPVAYSSPRNTVLAKLFTKMLTESLNEYAYAADIAGLTYEISNTVFGFDLRMRGYNDKQRVLLQKIFDRFRTLVIDLEMFAAILEAAEREYANFHMDQPYQHAMYNVTICTQNKRWHNDDYIAVCKDGVTGAELQQFVAVASQHLHLSILCHGNLTQEEAKAIGLMAEQTLKPKALHSLEFPQQRFVQLPHGSESFYRKAGLNPENTNSALAVFYQVGFANVRESALLEMVAQLGADEAYNQLRTVEQLGYIVNMAIKETYLTQGLFVLIQSTKRDASFLDQRTEAFLPQLRKLIEECTAQEWQQHAAAVVARRLEKPKTMNQESSRLWEEVDNGRFLFDWHVQVAQAVTTLSKEDVLQFFDQYIAARASKRARLSSQVFGKNHPLPPASSSTEPGVVIIEDIAAFKRSLPLFPCALPSK